jgi:hypothetical protein
MDKAKKAGRILFLCMLKKGVFELRFFLIHENLKSSHLHPQTAAFHREFGPDALPTEFYSFPAHRQLPVWENNDAANGTARIYDAVMAEDWRAARTRPQFYPEHCTQPTAAYTKPYSTNPSAVPSSPKSATAAPGTAVDARLIYAPLLAGVAGFLIGAVAVGLAMRRRVGSAQIVTPAAPTTSAFENPAFGLSDA